MLPGETKTGYLNPQVILRRELYPAMERAGIPRVAPTGEKRTFHSLRHTVARIAIEHNRPIFWLSKLALVARRHEQRLRALREGDPQEEAEAMAGVSASDVPCGVLTTRLARPRDSEAFC